MSVQFDNSSSEVSYLGLFGWIFFNVMALITVDGLQMFSYACAGFSAIAVGVYHVIKIYHSVKRKTKLRNNDKQDQMGDS